MTNGKTDQPTSEERGNDLAVEEAFDIIDEFDLQYMVWMVEAKRRLSGDDVPRTKSIFDIIRLFKELSIVDACQTIRAALSQPTVNDEFVEGLKKDLGEISRNAEAHQAIGWNDCVDHLHSQGLIGRNPQWQPIDDNTPRNAPLLLLPVIGLPFVGDIWSCAGRTDIEGDELARHRTAGGRIISYNLEEIEAWAHYPKLPNPPQEREDD